ncbi:16S rRNA (cytosine(1402)-N(4))-methyltransferase RsmH [bacterium]|nr:16S rRNA (cytosine(1402)-N(4))-methyltransferase RsmH [bacterium]
MAFHQPVLTREVIKILLEGDRKLFLDCTLGAGGHSEALLEAAEQPIKIFGIDKDPEALVLAEQKLKNREGIVLEHGDYALLDEVAEKFGFSAFDGILADLGQSSDQMEDSIRGFSHRFDGKLDMRYNPQSDLTAQEIVNEYSASELTDIFRRYGQERMSKQIAETIVRSRPVVGTVQLADLIRKSCPGKYIQKTLARIFMALRIVVNDELTAIEKLMPGAHKLLNPGGRMVFISYDSNQDRIVKDFFRLKSRICVCPDILPVCVCNTTPELKILTRRVIKPGPEEIETNPRSRSARLRAAEKLTISHEKKN